MTETEIQYGRIALVEDDEPLANLIRDFLSKEGYPVAVYPDGRSALTGIQQEAPDCVLLDIMLPGMDGMSVCRELRTFYSGPILFMTAKGDLMDEILGLEVGADGYLTKPVEPRRLLAHIRAQLRRSPDAPRSSASAWDIQPDAVRYNGEVLPLSGPERQLLSLLLAQSPEVVSRDEVMRHLRGIDHDGLSRTVDILVSDLRKKLPKGDWIATVRGRGYRWVGD